MFYLFVQRKIEKMRQKLHLSIGQTGLSSDETKKISVEIDDLINEYYNRSIPFPERKCIKEWVQ